MTAPPSAVGVAKNGTKSAYIELRSTVVRSPVSPRAASVAAWVAVRVNVAPASDPRNEV